MVKSPPANAGDLREASSNPGLGRSPGGRHGFIGSTKIMGMSKNPKSFPKSQRVIDTLESLSERHSFLLYDTIPMNIVGRDLLCK